MANKNIWETIYNGIDNAEKRSAENWDRYAASVKRKTSGPRWRVVKKIAAGLAIAGVIIGFVSFWAVGLALVGVSVVLGLAAKS